METNIVRFLFLVIATYFKFIKSIGSLLRNEILLIAHSLFCFLGRRLFIFPGMNQHHHLIITGVPIRYAL